MAWTTNTEVKAFFKVTGTELDSLITANIARAQDAIEQFLLQAGQVYGTFSNVIEFLTPQANCAKLFIERHASFDSVSYVKENGITLVLDQDYYLDTRKGCIIRASGYFTTMPNGVEIKYSVTKAVPNDLILACIEFTGVITGISSRTYVTSEGVENSIQGGIPEFIKEMLNRRWIPRTAMSNG